MTTLGIFLKQPEPGRVKTRLGSEIGDESAARLAAAFQEDILQRTKGVARKRILAYSPGHHESYAYFQGLASDSDVLWPQPDVPLGMRLAAFFDQFCQPAAPCVVIGSDSPTLPGPFLLQAYEQLKTADCVIGPAEDGGYYLIGLNEPQPELFRGIDWSTDLVFQQTLARAEERQLRVACLETWYDIDTIWVLYLH